MASNEDLLNKVKALLADTDITGYAVKKDTGIPYGKISALRLGNRSPEKLSLEVAIKLANYYDQRKGR